MGVLDGSYSGVKSDRSPSLTEYTFRYWSIFFSIDE